MIVEAIPLACLAVIVCATLLRGEAVRRRGDRAWAFTEARGMQRWSGSAFALVIVVIGVAGFVAVSNPKAGLALPLLGALVAIVGAAVVVVAQVQMGRACRVGVRQGDAPLFVRHGLFRHSRNPIFVGMIITGFGVSLTADRWWCWLALAIFTVTCAIQVRIEEAHLSASFGDDYATFQRRVPRWFGL